MDAMSMSGFSMKFNVLMSTRMNMSFDSLILHLSLMSSTKLVPRKVTMPCVPKPSLYLNFKFCKKATVFSSVIGTLRIISPFPCMIATLAPTFEAASSLFLTAELNAQLIEPS
jgi:hypothetical protein